MQEIIPLIVVACVLFLIIFLIAALYSFFRKNGKGKKFLLASLITVIVFIVCIAVYDEPAYEDEEEAQTEPTESIYIKFENALYNKEKDFITVDVNSNIEDGTTVYIYVSNPDTRDMLIGDAPVKDGKVSAVVGDHEMIENGNYTVSALVHVNEEENAKFKETYGNYDEITKKYAAENGHIEEDSDNDTDYVIDFSNLAKIEIKDAFTKEEIAIKEEELEKQRVEEKKQSALEIRFAELDKNPDKYAGEYVKYKGQIIQIMEDETSTDIRLAVTKDSYGYDFNDVIYITYEGTTEFVEDDIVTVYGTVEGSLTYESQAGYQITLPHIEAEIFE